MINLLSVLKRRFLVRRPIGAPENFEDVVAWLEYLLAVPNRYASSKQLFQLARFYADSPFHASLICLRVLYEVMAQCPELDGEKAAGVSTAILERIFTQQGASVLTTCAQDCLSRSVPNALEGRQLAVRIREFMKDTRRFRESSEYRDALRRGTELSKSATELQGKPEVTVAFVGLHYSLLFDHVQSHFEDWLVAQSGMESTRKLLRKVAM